MKIMRLFLSILFLGAMANAQSAENILLVLNGSSPVSLEIGEYYAQKRGIAAQNILRIRTALSDEISRQDYGQQIEAPIAVWLNRNSAQDRILYIVLIKGIPLRISGTSGADGTIASVDSELTLLYRKMVGQPIQTAGRINNPYYLGDSPVSRASQFSHEAYDIFLVCRLDGYSSGDIRALMERGYAPSKEGKILLDQKGTPGDKGEGWLQAAADWLNAGGFKDRVVLDSGPNVLKDQTGVLGYYSWGSNDPSIRTRHLNLGFVPGALAAMFVSSDGRSFSEPPADWQVGPWDDKTPKFAGSPQSMAGDLIRDGITGIACHVAEPYLEGTIRPQILFPAYLSGFNLIESFYLGMPYLSWQTVIVGDPLCAPFRSKSLTATQCDPGIDAETELPRYFSTRRLRFFSVPAAMQGAVHPDTLRLVLRAEVRLNKQDPAGARQALEEATARDGRLSYAHLILATLYDQDKEYDKAMERYRRVLDLTPDSSLALNNLAYLLAVRRKSVQEALPLAEKAYRLAKENPNISDTLGWIYHLLDNNEKANGLLLEAIQAAPLNAEIHLHMAVVSAALGRTDQAATELAHALELDPTLDASEEARQLRAKLKKAGSPFSGATSSLRSFTRFSTTRSGLPT